jgi:hypothetical protein
MAQVAAQAGLTQPGPPPSSSQVKADFGTWRPAAIVAVTPRYSALADYLTSLFGDPTVTAGQVLAWRR